MRVLFDLNVLLDLLLRRAPFYEHAAALQGLMSEKRMVGMVGANTLIALSHLLERALGKESATAAVARVLDRFEVRSIGRAALQEGLSTETGEYDDAVLYAAARHGRADAIVTRNTDRFGMGTVQVLTPGELLKQLNNGTDSLALPDAGPAGKRSRAPAA